MNFEKWTEELIYNMSRNNTKKIDKFLYLVENLKGNEGIEVLRVLLKTFSNAPDYSSQEAVNTIFLEFPPNLVSQAILEELPRLEHDGSKWILCLIGDRLHVDPPALLNALNLMDKKTRDLFRKWVHTPDFIEDFPQVIDILNNLKD